MSPAYAFWIRLFPFYILIYKQTDWPAGIDIQRQLRLKGAGSYPLHHLFLLHTAFSLRTALFRRWAVGGIASSAYLYFPDGRKRQQPSLQMMSTRSSQSNLTYTLDLPKLPDDMIM